MKIISFAWTTEALLAGAKTCTRRDWKERYALSFQAGEVVAGWHKSARAGGKKVAEIELLQQPYRSAEYPAEDYVNEGLKWMEDEGLTIRGMHPYQFWLKWIYEAAPLWVVRFRLLETP